jgi:hypothetical protein
MISIMDEKIESFGEGEEDIGNVDDLKIGVQKSLRVSRAGLGRDVALGKSKKKKERSSLKASSVEELKKEVIMTEKEADAEEKKFSPREKIGGLDDWDFYLSSLEGLNLPERNFYKYFLVNKSEKKVMVGDKEISAPVADVVFYYKLGEGKVKRMYAPYESFGTHFRVGKGDSKAFLDVELSRVARAYVQTLCDAMDAKKSQ